MGIDNYTYIGNNESEHFWFISVLAGPWDESYLNEWNVFRILIAQKYYTLNSEDKTR